MKRIIQVIINDLIVRSLMFYLVSIGRISMKRVVSGSTCRHHRIQPNSQPSYNMAMVTTPSKRRLSQRAVSAAAWGRLTASLAANP